MNAETLRLAAGVLATLALNATLVFALLALLDRWLGSRHPGCIELAWRGGMLAVLLSVLPVGGALVALAPPGAGLAAGPSPAAAPEPSPLPRFAVAMEAHDARVEARQEIPRAAASPPAPAAAGWQLPQPGEAALRWILLCWFAGTGASVLVLLLSALRLRRFAAAASAPEDVRQRAAELAGRFGMPVPSLRLDPALASPVALPAARICVPAWALDLPARQQRALLAHELWHLKRADPRWRVLHRLLLAPLFFHPLAWLALRRLDALAEHACDAAAARLEGSGKPLARCLAACLAAHQERLLRPAPHLAVAMSHRPGAVLRRVQTLLEESTPMRTVHLPSRRLRSSALLLAIAAAVALPSLSVAPAEAGERSARNVSIMSRDDGHSIDAVVSRDGYRLEVELDGKVRFADDESDVIALGDGDSLEIEEESEGVVRRVLFRGDDGAVQRSYEVDGDDQPWDASARRWVAGVLPEMFRLTGMDATPRAKRLLARGGPDALLAEIAAIDGDHVRSLYLAVALAEPGLTPAQLERALALAGEIESDFELRRTLAAALDAPGLDVERQRQLLQLALSIDSDFELAELLIAASSRMDGDSVPEGWAPALDSLGSDFERRRVLQALLEGDSGPRTLALVLDAAAGIGSDYETRVVLEKAAPAAAADPALLQPWLAAVSTIGSDFERRVALAALLQDLRPDARASLAVLDAIEDIGSDFEALQALLALAKVMPADGTLIQRYRTVARRLGDHERGQAERALDRFAVL